MNLITLLDDYSLNTSEMPLHSSINRMYLIISSQIDISEVLSGGEQIYSSKILKGRKKLML